MIPRKLFDADHDMFRESARRFLTKEVVPHHAEWEEAGRVTRDVWRAAGAAGLLCPSVAEEYGGSGSDYLYSVVVVEEMARLGLTGPGFSVHSEMVAAYIEKFGTQAQKRHWLPRMVAGEVIGALAITEPDAGSDVRGVRTTIRQEGGDFVIRGQKTYISNGQLCDFVVLVGKSDPDRPRDAISLVIVEADRPGFRKGRHLKKLGLKAQDTSELFFDDVRVPVENLVGELHKGFSCLTVNLAQERLTQAIRSAAVCEATIEQTVQYTSERKAFGQAISEFQNTQFKLAELQAATVTGRVMVDRCIEMYMEGGLDPVDAAIAKLQLSDLHNRVVDECLQLHGGWGYMWEYPVCRAYADARVVKIAGGSMEIMKQIIARSMFGGRSCKQPA